MRFVCITDLHGRLAALERVLAHAGPADAVLLGGDLTTFGSPSDAQRIVEAARAHVPVVLAVAGNCDSVAIDRRLVELGVSLDGRAVVLGNVGLHGVSGIPPWKKGMHQLPEEALASVLAAGADQTGLAAWHVVLAHVPPRETQLDQTMFWKRAGSTALREFIDRRQPSLVVCGHIHEGRGIVRMGQSIVVNCGHGASGSYALAQIDEHVSVQLCSA